jgi:hypothetical protein
MRLDFRRTHVCSSIEWRLTINRDRSRHNSCPLSGVKRTSAIRAPMSAYDPKRTWRTPNSLARSRSAARMPPSPNDKGKVVNLVGPEEESPVLASWNPPSHLSS